MSFSLVEMALVVNVTLIETDTPALFEVIDHFSLEFQLRERVFADELEDLSRGVDQGGARGLFLEGRGLVGVRATRVGSGLV